MFRIRCDNVVYLMHRVLERNSATTLFIFKSSLHYRQMSQPARAPDRLEISHRRKTIFAANQMKNIHAIETAMK